MRGVVRNKLHKSTSNTFPLRAVCAEIEILQDKDPKTVAVTTDDGTRTVALCEDDEAHVATWLTVGMTRGARAVMAMCLTAAGTLLMTRIHHAKLRIRQTDLGLFRGPR